jgi:RES domain-containing protein
LNTAFTHTNPFGNRFNRPERGAWYAAFSLETAGVEVAFHKAEELREINWQEKETFLYADFLADFRGEFHDIREDFGFAKCLDPNSYAVSQKLAEELLDKGSAGVVYPSVRHSEGTCIACFRAALVNNVRKGGQVSVVFENALATAVIHSES